MSSAFIREAPGLGLGYRHEERGLCWSSKLEEKIVGPCQSIQLPPGPPARYGGPRLVGLPIHHFNSKHIINIGDGYK